MIQISMSDISDTLFNLTLLASFTFINKALSDTMSARLLWLNINCPYLRTTIIFVSLKTNMLCCINAKRLKTKYFNRHRLHTKLFVLHKSKKITYKIV
jgi:hypothetical protein